MKKSVDVLAYRFGKGAEIHDCSQAPGIIYHTAKDILHAHHIPFSWHEIIPRQHRLFARKDEFGYKPGTIKNKRAVVEAITLLAWRVALSLLQGTGFPLVIGGDHTEGLGANKGLVLATTAQAVLDGTIPIANAGKGMLPLLREAVRKQDMYALTRLLDQVLEVYVEEEALTRFLASIYVIWFDAHGDYNTVETTPSGNAHGMAAAAIAGEGDKALTGIVGKWARVPPGNMYFVAARDLDEGEEERMKESGAHLYKMEVIREQGLKRVMDNIMVTIEKQARILKLPAIIHLSFDIDGIDAKYVPATGTPVGEGSLRNPAKGPELKETLEAFKGIASKVALIDLAESNFHPARDPEGMTHNTVKAVLTGFFGEYVGRG